MQRTLMVIWILVALTLPGFIHGRPAADDGRSVLSMFTAHASKLEDVLDYEQKPTSLFAQGGSLVPTKLRVNRSSDHRLSELETLMTMSKINSKRSPLPTGQASRQLDPARIGRRKRFIEKVPFEVIPIHQHTDRPKDEGNSAYSLIRFYKMHYPGEKQCLQVYRVARCSPNFAARFLDYFRTCD